MGMLSRAKPVKSLDNGVKMLVFGSSGTGKTTFSGTFPTPILLLDVKDRGSDSIAEVKGVDILSIEDWSELKDTIDELSDQSKPKWKTLVIDTFTQLQDLAIADVIERSKRSTADKDQESPTISMREWGEVGGMLKRITLELRDLPMNVLFLAQDRTANADAEYDEDNQLTPSVGPAIIPSAAQTLCASVSVIGNTFIKGVKVKTKEGKKKNGVRFCMRIGPNPTYITKIRKPKDINVPALLTNPSYAQIVSIIMGEELPTTKNKKG